MLLLNMMVGGCIGQNTNFNLRIIPPQNQKVPLSGTWEIVSLLKEGTANREFAQKWEGKVLHFSDENVLLGDYFLPDPHYQVKRVDAEAYLLYRQQAFPEGFHFQDQEIEVITLSDNHLILCELLLKDENKLLLNFFNNSYLAEKISDDVDETVFLSAETTDIRELGGLTDNASKHTGVLLGLRAPDQDRQDYQGEQYRTLWLALEDKKLAPVAETDAIVFPRRKGFYQLEVVRKNEDKKEEDFLIVIDHTLGQENLQEKIDGLELSPNSLQWEGEEGYIYRKIHYIGNDYVSLEETVRQTSLIDGSINEKSKLHVVAVDGLPGLKAVKISDLVGPSALSAMEEGKQNLLRQLGLEKTVQDDEENFGLARKMGYWILNGRLSYEENDLSVSADYNIDAIPPGHVVFYNVLNIPWPRVKNYVPGAVDILTSPNKDLALVITNNEIIVYGMYRENLAGQPLERIPLKDDEEIIMAEWALGEYYVENWTLTFQSYVDGEK